MKNTDPYKAGDAYSVPPFINAEDDGKPFTDEEIKGALEGVLKHPYLNEKIEERPDRAFANIKLGLEMAKRNVFSGDTEDDRTCRNELTLSMLAHEQEFNMLRDFANVFSRMHEHIATIHSTLQWRLTLIEERPDDERDHDEELRLNTTMAFLTMLINVHEGRDPLSGAQFEDVDEHPFIKHAKAERRHENGEA